MNQTVQSHHAVNGNGSSNGRAHAAMQALPPRVRLRDGFYVALVSVTPELAAMWLRNNHEDNRKIASNSVEALANDQKMGAWVLTHQAVAFDGQGRLVDGQHRLTAIVESGVACDILVVWNDFAEFKDPIDRTRPRSVNFLTGRRPKVNAATGTLRSLERGARVTYQQTPGESDAVYARHAVEFERILSMSGTEKLPGGTLAACVWALPINAVAVTEWASKVATGEMIARGNPAFAFRTWKDANKRADSWDVAMASLNSLRHWLAGESLSAVFTTESGYRAITIKRRVLRVPNTPSADVVSPGISL